MLLASDTSLTPRAAVAVAFACVTTTASLPAAAVTFFTDFGRNDGVAGVDSLEDPATVFNNTARTGTLTYDVSALGLGGTAATLQMDVTSSTAAAPGEPNRGLLGNGGTSGISIFGGANSSWWDAGGTASTGEPLVFTLSLRDGGGADVTANYEVDLIGVELRGNNTTGSATFNGSTVSISAAASATPVFSTFAVATGETSELVVNASRLNDSVAQLAAFEYSIEIPEPASLGLVGVGGLALLGRRRG
ncbi:PEP-CTERM sorting domain-containing protein [Phycisphaera mikurensis]|uniref:Ice-binding protein C-terminal domain-containing protein n=1 Tax=Phycisphaera mikurensis (strain NBRC 102666 / KCTC 22515 / FYK2301M01) TaxID=1142394 RepID=I0IFB2_PHYMF|nr:PEP-CTERM sorting domain-containing protein [Phycisphaera mikurensis]MBB6440655.1 hypothetical protein [Phycisphaera mikurensis]BAM03950.1 hypothetical protein PSMK_17910 [Phycisphaera mikurensis NBRC 102666]